jgi:hypothetical protein
MKSLLRRNAFRASFSGAKPRKANRFGVSPLPQKAFLFEDSSLPSAAFESASRLLYN